MIVDELASKLGLDFDGAAFAQAEAAIGSLHKGLLAVGVALVGGVAVGLASMVKATADAGDSARKLAQSTGVDSETIQELGYAAGLAQVEVGELAHGLNHLAKTGVKDVRAETLKLADQFAAMPDGGAKVALAMEKFGRAGARLIPLLNGGSAGVRELMNEAHDLGVVMSKEDQVASENLNDEVTRLQGAFIGLRNSIAMPLIRPLTRAVVWMREWVKAIRQGLPSMEAIKQAFKGVAFVLGGVLLTALVANGAALAALVAGYVAAGAAALLAAAEAAIAWLAAAAPVIGLTLLFALLLAVLEDVYGYFTGADSLLGELLPKWQKWMDEFVKPNSTDPWWLSALREAAAILRKIPEYASDASAFFSKIGGAPQGLPSAEDLRRTGFAGYGTPTARPDGTMIAPSTSIVINAQTGATAQDIAGHVSRAMDEHQAGVVRQAAAGLDH